ncbi:MAG: hypothetical protein KF752_02585 [Pirellulaceae bacterium]|nr:hypothetical protein [Pirellulaceae bacterium]
MNIVGDCLPSDVLPVAQWTVEPIFGWWLLVALSAITAASLWFTLSSRELSARRRWTLAGLRMGSLLLLLLGWLRPTLLTSIDRDTEGAIAVLLDRSQSMSLPSDSLGKSRWDVQRQVWRAIVDATGLQLGGTQVVPYFYDKELMPAESSDLPQLNLGLGQAPEGRITDLGQALAQVGQLQVQPPLRGVVMVGDATQTLVPPQHDPLLIARQMAQLNQPIFLVGVGARGEGGLLRDVALEAMPEQISAFANKEVSVPLIVAAQGMQNQPIDLRLSLVSGDLPPQELRRRKVLASQPSEKIAVDFRIQLTQPGDYLIVAEASVDTTEQITSNNKLLSFVTVRDGGVRILMVEGQPRYEQLYLKTSLDASIDFDLQFTWLPQRSRPKWPIDIGSNLDLSAFEAFVIGDLDSRAVSPDAWKKIVSQVQQGAGLLLLGGYHSFDAGGYQDSPLAPVIPLRLAPGRQEWNRPIDSRFHLPGPNQLVPTRPHPITNLLPEPDNARLWQSLKPLDGMNRFGQLSSSPGTQVLLEDAEGNPALVAGQFGQGRILAFAGDSTWKWYLSGEQSGQKRAHQTFWRQAMLWLVSRDNPYQGFRLDIDSRRQDIDAAPKIRLQWFGGGSQLPLPTQLKLALSRQGKHLRDLEVISTGDNSREATATGLDQPGLYEVRLTATGDDGVSYDNQLAFLVQDSSRELAQPAADWQMMSNLVAAGAAAGSQLFLPEETDRLVEQLLQHQNSAKVSSLERRRLGDAAWDSWLYFLLFCCLMTTEWALRRFWQLP